jgi:hypothetical protein
MKHFYKLIILSLGILVSQHVSAQKRILDTPLASPKSVGSARPAENSTNSSAPRGSAFFSEDFSNGLDGSTAYGPWTTYDNADGTLWHMNTPQSPEGSFNQGIPPLASTTASNGWVIFNMSEHLDEDTSFFSTYFTGHLTSPEINMTSLNSVVVNFQHYFVYCCYPYSPLTLEVSTDNVSWISFPAQGDFFESANELSDNPMNTSVDISCVAANQPSVWIRFSYNSIEQDGYFAYLWGIDDVTIGENTVTNDLAISEIVNGDIYTSFEYQRIPLEQVVPAADGGMIAGVIFSNLGVYTQPNVTAVAEFLNSTGAVIHTYESVASDILSQVTDTVCPANMTYTSFLPTGFEPTETGTYTLRITISGDSTDLTPANNTMEKSFIITTDEYGHDIEDELNFNTVAQLVDGSTTQYQPAGWGNYFQCPNDGSTAYGIYARFGNNSQNDVEFKVELLEHDATVGVNDASPVAEEFYVMTSDMHSGDFYYFPFDASADMYPGLFYFADVLRDAPGAGRLTMRVNVGPDSDLSTGAYERAGSGEYVWFLFQNITPAVRLVLSERAVPISTNDLDENISDIVMYPNPASSNIQSTITLENSEHIAWEIRDLNGKLVKYSNVGRMTAGENFISIPVEELLQGNYMMNFVISGKKVVSKPFTIQR